MIRTSVEATRGCGFRVPGGLYLVSGQLSEPCPLLPLEADRCPHCGQGIGPARGWTWITPAVLFPAQKHYPDYHNAVCPLGTMDDIPPAAFHRTGERAGLIWVGEKFYKTPGEFTDEAAQMGVSRRIESVPRGFEIGKDWVYLGHRKAIEEASSTEVEAVLDQMPGGRPEGIEVRSQEHRWIPGVITLFRPTAIEYVVKGSETEEELEALEKRGIQLVKVERAES